MSSEQFGRIQTVVDEVLLPRYKEEDREEMVSLFRQGERIGNIAEKFKQDRDKLSILKTAVRQIIVSRLEESEYLRLSTGRWGNTQKAQRKGIHSPDFDNASAWSRWAMAIGRLPYTPQEDKRLLELSEVKVFIKGTKRFHTELLSQKLHEEGYPLRTPKWIGARLNRLLQGKKEEK